MSFHIPFKVTLKLPTSTMMIRFSGCFTWAQFQDYVAFHWGCARRRLVLAEYVDDEGDTVTVATEEGWEEAVALHAAILNAAGGSIAAAKPPLRLTVTRAQKLGSAKPGEVVAKPLASLQELLDGDSDATVATEVVIASEDVDAATGVAVAAAEAAVVASAPDAVESSYDDADVAFEAPSAEAAAQLEAVVADSEPRREAVPVPRLVLPPRDPATVFASDIDRNAFALLSAMYRCDAAAELVDPRSRIDFGGVIERTVDPLVGDVHIDISLALLRPSAIVLSNQRMEEGDFAGAAEVLGRAVALFPADQILEYNLACALAQIGDLDGAVAMLSAAVEHGYRFPERIMGDVDLVRIRTEPRFAQMMHAHFPLFVKEQEDAKAAVEAATMAAAAAVAPIHVVVPAPSVTPRTRHIMEIFPWLTAAEAHALHSKHPSVDAAVNWQLNQ